MRPVRFQRNYIKHPAGAVLASFGDTWVLCTASISKDLPPFLKGGDQGWLTAEYAMLPGSTGGGRKKRDGAKPDGRSTEIQRLIGRSLRAAVHLDQLGPVAITLDCDVLQADGGTRTAAISGAWVALCDALAVLAKERGESGIERYVAGQVAAVSVGVVDGQVVCDLDYDHDHRAEVDCNVVKRDQAYVEIQGTGEHGVFDTVALSHMLAAADAGIEEIMRQQKRALAAQ